MSDKEILGDDLDEIVRSARENYRSAERGKDVVPGPYLVTLMTFTEEEAKKIIDCIRDRGGVIVQSAGIHTETVRCSVAEFRRWGEKTTRRGTRERG